MKILVKDLAKENKSFPKATSTIIDKMRETITRVTLLLQRRSKEKLSDDVLNVRTGRLRRSITSEVRDEEGQIVGVVGTNVQYAAIHEFGGTIDEKVREHVRLAKQAFGRELKTPVWQTVRAHTRHMVMPERSFLRSALNELKDDIPKELKAIVGKG